MLNTHKRRAGSVCQVFKEQGSVDCFVTEYNDKAFISVHFTSVFNPTSHTCDSGHVKHNIAVYLT